MRLTRCHVDLPLSAGAKATLPEPAAAHLVRVLRLREGDECVLFNGDGNDYDARIVAAGKRGGEVEVTGARPVASESPLRIVLLQGIARGEKMDWILQKATELGVVAVVPVESERSEVKLDGERVGKRIAHWRSVIVAACEQSGRAVVPAIAAPMPLASALDAQPAWAGLRLLLDPSAGQALDAVAGHSSRELMLAIGPEGGWSPRDRDLLQAAGFVGMRLGPRILRTETAGIAAIAVLQSRLGDVG